MRKMILVKACHKTYKNKFFVIFEAFKIWQYYLGYYNYKVLILMNHNNLCHFLDTENLNF